jgi:hypothetical protein
MPPPAKQLCSYWLQRKTLRRKAARRSYLICPRFGMRTADLSWRAIRIGQRRIRYPRGRRAGLTRRRPEPSWRASPLVPAAAEPRFRMAVGGCSHFDAYAVLFCFGLRTNSSQKHECWPNEAYSGCSGSPADSSRALHTLRDRDSGH